MNAWIRRARMAMLVAAALLLVNPAGTMAAESTNQAKPSEKGEKKAPAPHPFHGKLNGVDKAAKTISIGKSTYHITAETRIQKAGKPATLDAAVIGEQVGGFAKPGLDGKMIATSVTFGDKPGAKKK